MTIFQTRALSAAIFGIVMLIGLFWNEWSFKILFSIVMAGCAWEFLNLTLEKGILRRVLGFGFCVAIYLSLGLISSMINNVTSLNLTLGKIVRILAVLPFVIVPILSLSELFQKSEKPFQNVAMVFLTIFYISIPFFFLLTPTLTSMRKGFQADDILDTNAAGFTPRIVAGMLFLTWANDTFAYIIGSRIGKNPLFARISPKKTWEGTIGGGLMCMVTAGIVSLFFKELNTLNWVVVGGIIAIFGTLGDLVESMLKRSVGVKDSGTIMPGHGGFLDRFDAFVFCIPFVYAYLLVIG